MAEANTGEGGTSAPDGASKPVPAVNPAAPEIPKLQNDIQKILKEVKLPERRGDTPAPKQIKISVPDMDIAGAIGTPEGSVAPQAAAPEPKKDVSSVVPLHTFKDDVEKVVSEQHISLVRAASMESDKKSFGAQPEEAAGIAQRGKRMGGILFVSAVLIFLGCAALFGVYIVMQGTGAPQTGAEQYRSLVFAESSMLLPISGVAPADVKQSIAQAAGGTSAALGSITRLVPVITTNPVDAEPETRAATSAEFLHALGVRASEELIRALGDEIFLGIHTVDRNAALMVIPVLAYDRAFSGMLQWENTMNADLSPIFPAVPAYTAGENGIPTERRFNDTVMRNYDTRTLSDDAGNIVLYYSFPTPNLLIIAQSPYTFTEILSRLQSQRQL